MEKNTSIMDSPLATTGSASATHDVENQYKNPQNAPPETKDLALNDKPEPSIDSYDGKGKRKFSKPPSSAWKHFDIVGEGLDRKARCKYCSREYVYVSSKSGTSNLNAHIAMQCKLFPGRYEKKQKTLAFENVTNNKEGVLVAHTFSIEACRLALAEMIIVDELPFSHVENEGFKKYSRVLEPRFQVPSRTTIARDCLSLFLKEKDKLKEFFSKSFQRVCLTTDTWTSAQNLNYMCLTAHFIDDNWKLQKRILNFCVVPSHKGDILGKAIEQCLLDWGIDKIFTITVDNASSNNTLVSYLRKKVNNWGGAILDGQHMHMRCAAHILNLVVREGLKEHDSSISKIREVVKYVKGSPSRLLKFKDCAEQEKIDTNKLLCLDVVTRWNSTYLMLEAAIRFQNAFERLEEDDVIFKQEFNIGNDSCKTPDMFDWSNAHIFVRFLKIFYDATLRFSGSVYVTSNLFLDQICFIHNQLSFWCENTDFLLSKMAKEMIIKFNKYWGGVDKMNDFLFIATLLDPRRKEQGLKICLDLLCDEDDIMVGHMMKKFRQTLNNMFDQYLVLYSANVQATCSQPLDTEEVDSCNIDSFSLWMDRYKKRVKDAKKIDNQTEVDKYLGETCEDVDDESFNLLSWWKVNSSRYKVLSKIAKDVLAMPISTVASESAFSTGGRVIDSFRSSLSPKTVQALICTQNWIRSSPIINIRDSLDDIEAIETDMLRDIKDITLD